MPIKNIPIGQMLLEENYITQQQLDDVLALQKKDPSTKLGDLLLKTGAIDEHSLMKALESHLKVPFLDLGQTVIDRKAPAMISEDLALKHTIIPIAITGKVLTIATSDPMNFYALDDIRLATNMELKVVLSTPSDIKDAIGHFYSSKQAEDAAAVLSRAFDNKTVLQIDDQICDRVDDAPVVKLVNSIITQAASLGASDIHIEPLEARTRVRMRIDGILQDKMTLALGAHSSIVTRLKIMGNMNIAERRLPQDGRVEAVIDNKAVDLRLSVLPTVTGEKVVIRILGGLGSVMSIENLGLSKENLEIFNEILKSPNGIILISGPTGSGKTTTLYSILTTYNKPGVNIITVEDPVEYHVSGVNQVQVNPKAGLTFANGLRSILRQDPDIIMIGEIRDNETAQIAVRAAITGHLVLSTIHTNDAASTISRLVNMEVEPYLVSSGIVGIIAQRLVRKICPRCRKQYTPSDYERRLLGLSEDEFLHKGEGCHFCGQTGYKGRTAIHEIMAITKEMRELIDEGVTTDKLREASVRSGTVTLTESCKKLVMDGITTVEEMLKVTYNLG